MRLGDMWKHHPRQNNDYICSQCKERVGIYPTGMRQIKFDPSIIIKCIYCIDMKNLVSDDVAIHPAAFDVDELVEEMKESVIVAPEKKWWRFWS